MGRLRQEDGCALEANLEYAVSSVGITKERKLPLIPLKILILAFLKMATKFI